MKTVFNHTTATRMPLLHTLTCKLLLLTTFVLVLFTSCGTSKETVCVFPNTTTYDYTPPKPLEQVTATINGNITDRNGNALEGVKVLLSDSVWTTTNAAGTYSFTKTFTTYIRHTINFKKGGYNTSSRSFNTAMGNTQFDVQLGKPCVCDSIVIDNCFLQNSSYNFEPQQTKLSNSQKQTLDALISCLKSHPESNILIKYNLKNADKTASAKRLDVIRNYIVNQGGISESRITKKIDTSATLATADVEIVPDYMDYE